MRWRHTEGSQEMGIIGGRIYVMCAQMYELGEVRSFGSFIGSGLLDSVVKRWVECGLF